MSQILFLVSRDAVLTLVMCARRFLMGLFSYVYYSSLIREHHVTVGSVLQTVVTHLTVEDQTELYRELARYLQGQGKLARV